MYLVLVLSIGKLTDQDESARRCPRFPQPPADLEQKQSLCGDDSRW